MVPERASLPCFSAHPFALSRTSQLTLPAHSQEVRGAASLLAYVPPERAEHPETRAYLAYGRREALADQVNSALLRTSPSEAFVPTRATLDVSLPQCIPVIMARRRSISSAGRRPSSGIASVITMSIRSRPGRQPTASSGSGSARCVVLYLHGSRVSTLCASN